MRVVGIRVKDVNELVQAVLSRLSPLVIKDVADEGERLAVRARTPQEAAVRPAAGVIGAGTQLSTAGGGRRTGG